MSKNTIR